jgi:hypothetical protein
MSAARSVKSHGEGGSLHTTLLPLPCEVFLRNSHFVRVFIHDQRTQLVWHRVEVRPDNSSRNFEWQNLAACPKMQNPNAARRYMTLLCCRIIYLQPLSPKPVSKTTSFKLNALFSHHYLNIAAPSSAVLRVFPSPCCAATAKTASSYFLAASTLRTWAT